jgi:hypothetical protein
MYFLPFYRRGRAPVGRSLWRPLGLAMLALCCFLSESFGQNSEEKRFTISIGDNEVGFLMAQKQVYPDSVRYTIYSKISFRIIARHTVEFSQHSSYEGDRLLHSRVTNKVDESIRDQSRIAWRPRRSDYLLHTQDEESKVIGEPITYGTALLYFQEPLQRERLFSIKHAQFLSLKKDEASSIYRLELPNGRQNHYYYESGTFYKALIDHLLADVTIQ